MFSEFNTVDFDFLVNFCSSNNAARVYMDLYSRRQRWGRKPKTIGDLQRLAESIYHEFTEDEVDKCFKGFQEANCGSIQRASKYRKRQFQWKLSPIEIGKEVMKRLNQ